MRNWRAFTAPASAPRFATTWPPPSRAPSARQRLDPLTPDSALVDRFAADLGALAVEGSLGLAVSGGPDSVALLLLAAAARPNRVRAISIDHGLRPEAAAEVQSVAALCDRLGVPHETIALDLDDGANLQARARAERYAALAAAGGRHGLAAIATGHHADDQAETLLMRLARGAGVSGLAGVRARQSIAGATIVRPLLGWRKEELQSICDAAGVTAADDRSNRDARFDRSAVRAAMRGLSLDPAMLARSAAFLAEAEAALEWSAEANADRLRIDGDHALLDIEDLPPEIVRRLLLRAFAVLERPRPRGPDLERAMAAMADGDAASLSGLILGPLSSTSWRLAPEPPRRS